MTDYKTGDIVGFKAEDEQEYVGRVLKVEDNYLYLYSHDGILRTDIPREATDIVHKDDCWHSK